MLQGGAGRGHTETQLQLGGVVSVIELLKQDLVRSATLGHAQQLQLMLVGSGSRSCSCVIQCPLTDCNC